MSKQTESKAADQLGSVAAEELNRLTGLLTIGQVAERLNVGERFVRRLIHERRIDVRRLGEHVPNQGIGGGSVRWRRARFPLRLGLVVGGLRDGRSSSFRSGPSASLGPLSGLVTLARMASTVPAPNTFATKTDADVWLTIKEAEIRKGDWLDPDALIYQHRTALAETSSSLTRSASASKAELKRSGTQRARGNKKHS